MVADEIDQFREDYSYLNKSYSRLKRKYANEFVAIKNKRVIAHGSDLHEVIKKVSEKKYDPALTVIDFIYDGG